ncbi:MAG: pseudouridine synthase [Rhodomicrobium sp.]|nr:MAG: pseudouridine synthase [Rhodomicrobium sp.]
MTDETENSTAPPATPPISSGEEELIRAVVPVEAVGTRLDRFLADLLPDHTRSRLKDLIKAGQVMRGDNVILSPNARVKEGDVYDLRLPPAASPVPLAENIPLNVIYEDDDLIVIDKPAGMVVHPATGHWRGTLVNALLYHCGESLSGIGGVKRPGIVHRLDKQTSGLMVVAKNDKAHLGLSRQFADHGRKGPLTRAYTAFVWGVPQPQLGRIETEIGRSPKNALKMAVLREGGKVAITHYDTKKRYGDDVISQVTCRLETGRTHQIRVHLTHLGHPLLADPLYATGFKTKSSLLPDELNNALKSFDRQALHAHHLGFSHPRSGETMLFDSDLPADMQHIENLFETLLK